MVKVITRDELVKWIKSGERFRLVDVLSKESYEREHIKGAVSIPLNEIEAEAPKKLDKEEKIVVYCASFQCMASTNAAGKLMSMGYKNVLDYKGGIKDYKEAGLPLEGSACAKVSESACTCC